MTLAWSKDPFAFAVLKETREHAVGALRTEGRRRFQTPKPDSALDFLFDDEPSPKPEKVSRYFVRLWIRRRAERADKEKRR